MQQLATDAPTVRPLDNHLPYTNITDIFLEAPHTALISHVSRLENGKSPGRPARSSEVSPWGL